MTKSEVRTLSILKMGIQPGDVIWDIGAGTGSISVEIAYNYPDTKIIAIERNPEAISLIRDNMTHFKVSNIEIIQGLAPDVFSKLEPPTTVIIGGSGGNLSEILNLLWSYNSLRHIVINAVTLNTAYQAIDFLNQKNALVDSFQMSISVVEMIKDYQMLKAQNPIFIISGKKQEELS